MLWMLLIFLGEESHPPPQNMASDNIPEGMGDQRSGSVPLRRTHASLPSWVLLAQPREEDGGSRGRNLCPRDGENSGRESVAVMQRTPAAPLPLFSGPCREAAMAYWGQTGGGGSCDASGAVGTPRSAAAQRHEEPARAAAWAVPSHPGKPRGCARDRSSPAALAFA